MCLLHRVSVSSLIILRSNRIREAVIFPLSEMLSENTNEPCAQRCRVNQKTSLCFSCIDSLNLPCGIYCSPNSIRFRYYLDSMASNAHFSSATRYTPHAMRTYYNCIINNIRSDRAFYNHSHIVILYINTSFDL